jgi:hypothetical protein
LSYVDTADEMPRYAVAEPVIGRLAHVIDREFARRDPADPTPYDFAAEHLGVPVGELIIVSDHVEPLVGHSVGCWLLATHARHPGPVAGGRAGVPASSELVEGALGDVYAYRSATVLLQAGVLHTAPVVLRIARLQFEYVVELMAAGGQSAGLSTLFTSFLRERTTSGSPYRLGSYRVSTGQAGIELSRWLLPSASRTSLRLDDSVWRAMDRSVHRVLELSDDLQARGLGTSSGVLLVGPPGTGKTQLGMVMAGELVGKATVLVPGAHAVEHYLTELFETAAALSPCLVLLDDLDLVAGERGAMNPHKLREFLNVMDGGLADRSGVVVVASTNDHKKVDKAAQRSSRFDVVIKMVPPSYDARLTILRRYLEWCTADLDLAAVAAATGGATGADLKELVRQAVLDTHDQVSTEALLEGAREGRWSKSEQIGVYL